MKFQVGKNRCAIYFEVKKLGKDLLVTITGGDAHIGAVSLSLTTKNIKISQHTFTSSHLLVINGHKEGDIAATLSNKITKSTGKNCVLIVGIHINNITQNEIEGILDNCQKGIKKIIKKLTLSIRNHNFS